MVRTWKKGKQPNNATDSCPPKHSRKERMIFPQLSKLWWTQCIRANPKSRGESCIIHNNTVTQGSSSGRGCHLQKLATQLPIQLNVVQHCRMRYLSCLQLYVVQTCHLQISQLPKFSTTACSSYLSCLWPNVVKCCSLQLLSCLQLNVVHHCCS